MSRAVIDHLLREIAAAEIRSVREGRSIALEVLP
jgi:hypothetical protein